MRFGKIAYQNLSPDILEKTSQIREFLPRFCRFEGAFPDFTRVRLKSIIRRPEGCRGLMRGASSLSSVSVRTFIPKIDSDSVCYTRSKTRQTISRTALGCIWSASEISQSLGCPSYSVCLRKVLLFVIALAALPSPRSCSVSRSPSMVHQRVPKSRENPNSQKQPSNTCTAPLSTSTMKISGPARTRCCACSPMMFSVAIRLKHHMEELAIPRKPKTVDG